MEKEIFNSIQTAALAVNKTASVRYGYLSEVQEQNQSLPLVVVPPMATTSEVAVIGKTLRVSYTVRVMVLFGDSYGKATDKRSAGRLTSRLDTYDQAQTMTEAIYNQVAADLGTVATIQLGSVEPLQTVSTQTLTGKVVTFRVVQLKSYC